VHFRKLCSATVKLWQGKKHRNSTRCQNPRRLALSETLSLRFKAVEFLARIHFTQARLLQLMMHQDHQHRRSK
jgi:hypothetical protein